ncbi:MAG TPA: MbnP family protein, partial [Cytophagaceae bacterium]|nr:MbnP family protein [Cytophagaceae bacterium]
MKKSIIITGLFVLTCLMGCKKTVEPQPASTTGTLYFHFHTLSDTAEFLPGDTVRDASGRKYKYSIAQVYISGVSLIKLDGTSVPVNNVTLFVHPGTETYLVGAVPVGNYKSVAFNIGIDTAHNHKDPSSYTAGNPL